VSPQPQSIPFGPFHIFWKVWGDIRKPKCTTGINDTGGKFATGLNNTGGKFATGLNDTGGKFATCINSTGGKLPPVSTTPAAANFSTSFASVVDTGGKFATGVNDTGGKLPLVSTMLVANCHRYQRHRQQICHRCQGHRWQIMETISGFRHLKVNLKAKIYIYVNITTQRCPSKIIKIYLIEDFFHLTPVVHLELGISPQIFKKI
jgi:hypothetical protein